MNNVGKAALLGGVALLLAGGKASDRSANVPALAAQPSNQIDANALYDLLLNNPELLKVLRGAQGIQGIQGIQGLPGVSGSTIKPFGGSLVKNSALELDTLEGWTGSNIALGAVHEGLASLELTGTGTLVITSNSDKFHIDNRRLYKITCTAKTTAGNYFLSLRRYNKAGVEVSRSGDPTVYPLNNATLNNTAYQKVTKYFGGTGTTTNNIGLEIVKGLVVVSTSFAATVSVAKLIVEEVPLGEPVPYNLAYLPDWQVVYDPTTGDMGIFNGTAVVWPS